MDGTGYTDVSHGGVDHMVPIRARERSGTRHVYTCTRYRYADDRSDETSKERKLSCTGIAPRELNVDKGHSCKLTTCRGYLRRLH